MNDVIVTIDAKWVKRVRSPAFWVIGALTWVSVTFIPLYLFFLGKEDASFGDARVLICLAIIYIIPSFYMHFSGGILRQIHRSKG